MRLRRRLFTELVERQLLLFEEESAGLIHDCDAALRAYHAAGAGEAEDRYADFLDLVDTGRVGLEEIRDAYAQTLDETTAEEYRRVFNETVRKRLPRFGLGLE